MRALPPKMVQVLAPFAPLFSKRVFRHAQVLLIGAFPQLRAPGRSVPPCVRWAWTRRDASTATTECSAVPAGRVWRSVACCWGCWWRRSCPKEVPLVVGIDETLERRYGKKIAVRGVYRDPVRSTHQTFVKSSGLRWVCAMLLVEIPWASRVWALPFLSALAPSERYAAKRGIRHKKITEWAWQLLLVLRRWYPQREIVAVADRAYASLKLLDQCRKLSNPITFITRLRLDAALSTSPLLRVVPGR